MNPGSTRPARQGLLITIAYNPMARYSLSGLVFIVHLVGKHSDYTYVHSALAGTLAVITLNVLLTTLRSKGETLPILAWVFLQYYIFWVFPIFVQGESTEVVTFSVLRATDSITWALLAIFAFVSSVVAGHKAAQRWLPRRNPDKPPSTSRQAPEGVLLFAAVVSLLVSYQLIWQNSAPNRYYYILFVLFSPSLVQLFFIYELRNFKPSRMLRLGYSAFVGAAILIGLLSGRLEFAIMPFVVIILTQLAALKRARTGYVLLLFAVLILIQPAKFFYRESTGFRTRYASRLSLVEGVGTLGRSIDQSWSGGRDDYTDNLQGLADRLNELTKIGAVLYSVPKIVQFDRGTTFEPVIYGFVPRVFWKAKPDTTEMTNNYFNVKLGFQSPRDCTTTTASMPIVAEAYFNFGWLAIALVGVFCGLVFGLLANLMEPRSRLLYVGTYFIMVDMRSTEGFVNFFNGVWKTFIFALCWCVIFALASRLSRRRPTLPSRPATTTVPALPPGRGNESR